MIEDIKQEIRSNCPKLITDGSRAFRAFWRDYCKDHLELVVETHHRVPPTGNAYYDNREKVLEAVARAAERNGVTFSIPTLALSKASRSGSSSAVIPPKVEIDPKETKARRRKTGKGMDASTQQG